MLRCGAVLAGLGGWGCALRAASVVEAYTYTSTVTADANGPLDLAAELNYDDGRAAAPIAVVMHGYSGLTGKTGEVRANAQRLRDKGFFAISVALRQRDGSDGVRDSGGLEIYDIYDAVEAVKRDYSALVDPATVYLTGYSGGGGNTMAAVTKFPNAFNAAAAFFGMSDYGFNLTNGWYFNGASSSHQAQMRADVGNPTGGVSSVRDRYHARASNLAAANNPYAEIRLFVNANETTCPPVNALTYLSNAVGRAAFPGEFSNITVHVGQAGVYADLNANGVDDPDEQQYWPHGAPTQNQQDAAENWFMARLLAGQLPRRALNASDTLYVAGFVKTSRFECRVGDGQQGALQLDYALTDTNLTFHAQVLSLDKAVNSELFVDTAAFAGKNVAVLVNGTQTGTFAGGGVWSAASLLDGDTVELRVAGTAEEPPKPRLLAFYDFDRELMDQTTNAFHGVSATSGGAGVTFTNLVPAALAARSHESAVFDGKSWVRLPFLNLYGRAQDGGLSVSLWIRGGSSASLWALAEGCTTSTAPAYCFGPRAGVSTFRAFVRTDSNSGRLDRQSSGAVFDGAWHHVVWTDAAGTARLYIDGAVADTTGMSYTPGALTLNTTTIGALQRKPADLMYPFVGGIDDLAVWGEALSTDSIAALSAGVSPLELAGRVPDSSQPARISAMAVAGDARVSFTFTGPTLAVQPRLWYTTNLADAGWAPVAGLLETTRSNGVYYQSFGAVPAGPSAFFKVVY